MTDRNWLLRFVDEAARDPRRLICTIATAKKSELPAVVAALEMVENPAVKVFGFAALARRDPKQRQAFLARAAAASQSLEDREARAGVLTALVDALSDDDAAYFAGLLTNDINAVTEADQRRRFKKLFTKRSPRSAMGKEPFDYEPLRRIDTDLEIDEIATRMAGMQRYDIQTTTRIRSIKPTLGLNKVRLNEIGHSVSIDPHSFKIKTAAMPAAAASGALHEAALSVPRPPERIVNTGFADVLGEPTDILVAPSSLNRYFIEIGERIEGALDSSVPLHDDLKEGAIVDVVLFTNNDGLTIQGPDRGRFKIQPGGTVTVIQPAATVAKPHDRRMFFAFRAPVEKTTCSMRCSFYSRGLLIQSRNITIPVGTGTSPTITPDYILSRTLSPQYLAQMQPPTLSMMLNANADGTHAFRFYGENGELTNSSTFGEGELKAHIDMARAGLRMATWGTDLEWTDKDKNRFAMPKSVPQVLPDLYELAYRGHVMWDATVSKLAGGPAERDKLYELMKGQGVVQLALKEDPRYILPLAMFYDHEFTPDLSKDQIKVCPGFLKSLAADDLADEPCFNGDCPSRELGDTICPGGFWGYRHAIGLPPSLGAQQTSPSEIPAFVTTGKPSFTVGVSTDPKMISRVNHLRRLKEITQAPQDVYETRNATVDAMKATTAPLVYFYCHGGWHPKEGPYLQVGPTNGPRIAHMNLSKVRWKAPRPLVFINGCHTAAVSPEQAFDLVKAFVSEASASGVIGTEITIFESLATSFAESFFDEFVVRERTAGEAIRRARLRILKKTRNPLGLVYIPFILPGLQLHPAQN